MSSLVSAVKGAEGDIASALWPLGQSKGLLGQRGTGLGLPFLWDAEARDCVVAQRPDKICAVKLVMSGRHMSVKGDSIQP